MNLKLLTQSVKQSDLVIALVLCLIYFFVVFPFGYLRDLPDNLFAAPDAKEYLGVGEWLWGGDDTDHLVDRPFLYPLLVVFAYKLGGMYFVWYLQFLLWLLTGILVYRITSRLTGNSILADFSVLLYGGNISLLAFTLNGIPETTMTFLLALGIFLLSNPQKIHSPLRQVGILFVIASATTMKPVIGLLLAIFLVTRTPLFYKAIRKNKNKLKFIVFFVLALSPIWIQMFLVKAHDNKFTFSEIGPKTFDECYLTGLYWYAEGTPILEAQAHIASLNPAEKWTYLQTHCAQAIQYYFRAVLHNLVSFSSYTNDHNLYYYTFLLNGAFACLHFAMIPFVGFALFKLLRQAHYFEFEIAFWLCTIVAMIFLSSGLSYWQGDRLIAPATPFWAILYSFTFSVILRKSGQSSSRPF